MIRGKGEALSPAKINRNVWSNPAVQVKGLFTVSAAPPPLRWSTLFSEKTEGWGRKGKGREEEKRMEEADRRRRREQGRELWKLAGRTHKEAPHLFPAVAPSTFHHKCHLATVSVAPFVPKARKLCEGRDMGVNT